MSSLQQLSVSNTKTELRRISRSALGDEFLNEDEVASRTWYRIASTPCCYASASNGLASAAVLQLEGLDSAPVQIDGKKLVSVLTSKRAELEFTPDGVVCRRRSA